MAGIGSKVRTMNDPHVESLSFHFISEDPNDTFDETEPLIMSLGTFEVDLQNGKLTVRPQEHFANEESAKVAFEPLLHSWEITALLHEKRYRIRFKYDNAHVIDRNPSPPPSGTVVGLATLTLEGRLSAIGTLVASRNNKEYPNPDPSFQTSTLTDELIFRYKRYLDGRELLTTMANWVETRLRKEYGNRSDVAKALNIHEEVLRNIGKFCATNDPLYGRKAQGKGPEKLTSAHRMWLDKVIPLLILRVGKVNDGLETHPQITLKDLPQLDEGDNR